MFFCRPNVTEFPLVFCYNGAKRGGERVQHILYGDVYLLINFSLDALALVLAGCFLRRARRLLRIMLAALLGAIYALAALLLPPLPFLLSLCLDLLAAALLCLAAYGYGGFFAWLKTLLAFYTASVLLGGAVSALYSMLAELLGVADGSFSTDGRRAEIFLLFALISGVIIHIGGRVLSRHSRARAVAVEVECDGRHAYFRALSDSGNLLTDPLSGKAVIVCKREALGELLPPTCFGLLSGRDSGIPLALRRRLRVVVAHGIGGGVAMLGFVPDSILIAAEEEVGEAHAVDAILAVAEKDIRDFGGYAAIVPTVLVG